MYLTGWFLNSVTSLLLVLINGIDDLINIIKVIRNILIIFVYSSCSVDPQTFLVYYMNFKNTEPTYFVFKKNELLNILWFYFWILDSRDHKQVPIFYVSLIKYFNTSYTIVIDIWLFQNNIQWHPINNLIFWIFFVFILWYVKAIN